MTEKRSAAVPAWLLVLVAIVVFGAGGLGIFVAGNRHADVSVSAEVGPTTTVRIPVEGMICVVCSGNVKKALQSIDGVQDAEISLERREAQVRYSDGKVSPEQLVAAINQLGYRAGTPVPEASQ